MSTTTTKKRTPKPKAKLRKSNPGKTKFPCKGEYLTHAWPMAVSNVPVSPALLAIKCERCGLTFGKMYEFRKKLSLSRYHNSK